MEAKTTFPVRLKILITLLVLVTAVVSAITYSMAGAFQEDKKTYIHDLASVLAMSTSEECRSLLGGYEDRLRVYGRTMTSAGVTGAARNDLLAGYFREFRGLVGLVLYEGRVEKATIFDTNALDAAGMTKERIQEHFVAEPPAFDAMEQGDSFVENRTLDPAMPMFALGVALEPAADEAPRALVALLRLDALQRLSSRSDAFDVFLVDRNGALLAHPDRSLLSSPTEHALPEALGDLRFGAGITLEFSHDGTEMIGGYARPNFGGVTAGVQIPRSAAFVASRDILRRLTLVGLLLLLGAVLTGMIVSRTITRPVERLVQATQRVGRGDFDIKVRVSSADEIGTLSTSFNRMAGELRTRDNALHDAQKQLIQSEKMAAFGQLGAGVAHEVKNPLAGILACAQLSLRKVGEGTSVHRNLTLIEKETKRCKNIVENLLRFARQEKAVLEATELDPVLDDAVAIVNHQLELNRVKVEVDKEDELPRIRASANQLQQVLINLMMNAQQAMGKKGGTVTVGARRSSKDLVELFVRDDGPGIPSEIQAKIFEPFFTTKPGGKGTGLGLSVSYGIVKDHGGEITLESAPGEGACFRILLPTMPNVAWAAPVNKPAEPSAAEDPEAARGGLT
ncbi:MAG TPA: ATP-binding protein [bacterium]|nr:ATP-binding protein [bacterium]